MKPFAATAAAGVLSLLVASVATAQTTLDRPTPPAPRVQGEPPLVSTYSADLLRDLPTADNLFDVLDVLQPSIIGDRFAGGGLAVGQPARLGGFLTSWTQTLFSIDNVPFSDPSGTGAAMLAPELLLWSKVRVATGAFPASNGAQGLSIDLAPPTPGQTWRGVAEGVFSHGGMNAAERADDASITATDPLSNDRLRAIARTTAYDRVGMTASGPLSSRVGATFALSATRGREVSRYSSSPVDARAFSGFTQFVLGAGTANEVRVLGWGQQTSTPATWRHILSSPVAPAATRSGGHGQLVWTHVLAPQSALVVSGSYSARRDGYDGPIATSGVIDRLLDGPVSQFTALGDHTIRTWSGAAVLNRQSTRGSVRHVWSAGLQGQGGQLLSSSMFNGTIGELIGQTPARVWQFLPTGTESDRNSTTIAAFADDTMTLSGRLTLAGGLRFEAVRGSAQGAAQDISWNSMLPRARLTFAVSPAFSLFASYTRSAQRLTLDTLAYGDPAASIAAIRRWNAPAGIAPSLNDRGPVIAVVGPGAGTDPQLTYVDPDLQRPTSDEVVFGFDARPIQGGLIRLAGISRHEHHLMGLINTGNPSYTSSTINDLGPNVLDPADDTVVSVYNRVPSSFLRDTFLLTTPENVTSSLYGIELTLQYENNHVMFSGAATAAITDTPANSIGFGPLENDQTVIGELYTNPNAAGFSQGRSFNDRAFTGKIATVAKLPWQTRLGLIARYQDGQNFARVIVVPDLNQGAEAVRAFANGDHRFMFVGTLDLRLQKTFNAGPRRVDAFIDGYNILNLRYSVEERMDTLPDDRTPTVVQPPISLHAGFRLRF